MLLEFLGFTRSLNCYMLSRAISDKINVSTEPLYRNGDGQNSQTPPTFPQKPADIRNSLGRTH